MPSPEINAIVPAGALGRYLGTAVSPVAIQDIMEALEAMLMVAPEPQQEEQAPIAVRGGAHEVTSRPHVLRCLEVVAIADHVRVLPEVAVTAVPDQVRPEAAVTVLHPEEVPEVMAEALEDQEALAEVLEVDGHQAAVPQEEEAGEEGTNSKKSSNKKIR